MSYTAPAYKQNAFNCPYCGAFSRMVWDSLWASQLRSGLGLWAAKCTHCDGFTCWQDIEVDEGAAPQGRMIIPDGSVAPLPHPEMPEAVANDYLEARSIVSRSPRGAAALLRLTLQKLCVELGETSGNINTDIGSLVRKGMAVEIQQALDVVRVVGNNSVHPGELSETDIADIASTLFELVNAIVEDRISRPKKLAALFERLPEGAREAITKRDAPKPA